MQNIATRLTDFAKLSPHNLAVIEQKSGRRYSYRQLDEISDIMAVGLQARGIVQGTRTILMFRPGFDFFALIFALFKIGAVLVAVDPGIGIRRLGRCLTEAEPQAFIGISWAHIARLLLGWAKKTIKINIIVDNAFMATLIPSDYSLASIRCQTSKDSKPSPVTTHADDMAAILFTSGSTGSPKGVIYSHANFDAQISILQQLYGLRQGEVDLSTFPLFALFATTMGLTAVVPDMDFTRPAKVNPEKLIALCKQHQVHTLFGSPALLQRVGRYAQGRRKKLPDLRRVISAGAPVSAKTIELFSDLLPDAVQIFTPYGATESLPMTSIGSREILQSTRHQTEQGMGVCVGKPVPNIKLKIIRIIDKTIPQLSDDLLLENKLIGEIVVQGAQVSAAYYGPKEQTARAKIADPNGGFYHRTGDSGYLDQQGRLWFCGRLAHRVVVKGRTLFSVAYEGIFNSHRKVFRSALVGIIRDGQTVPVICIELQAEDQWDDKRRIRAELLKLAAMFEQTKCCQHVLFHTDFPVDPRHNAKIERETLALWAVQQLL